MAENYRLVLVDAGPSPRRVVACLREITGFSLPKAEWFLSQLPLAVLDGLAEAKEAEQFGSPLEQVGAQVRVERSRTRRPVILWHPVHDRLSARALGAPVRPPSFGWLIENRLAGMGRPATAQEIEFLNALGVELLVSLTETALPSMLQEALAARVLHLPTVDLGCPAREQVDRAVQALREVLGAGGRAVVHCGAGLGRTGLILACFLVSEGASAGEALGLVRAVRPGSIETVAQEQFLRAYAEALRPAESAGGPCLPGSGPAGIPAQSP